MADPDSDPGHGVNVLPIGTHLGEFEIVGLIGEGGFGIVYLAYDHSLERHVALKEYMPSGLAMRTTKMAVTVRSQHNLVTFTAGLKSFVNEAKMLAQFDSPSLVKVHRFWEGNGTAYMVMPFYEGITLKQALKEHRITPAESWIRLLLADLFDAIETIHHAQCFHRDIAPDNILLLKDGRPLLLDFGAARRVIGDLTQCLTVILKPGFAPIEQYADIASLRQGAWTDIYALAAVVYYLMTSKAPPPAVARMVHDEMVPAREAGKGRYSDSFLAVLDKALAVKPEQRFRSIAELRRALDIMETVPRTLPRTSLRWTAADEPTTRMADPPPSVKPVAQPERDWQESQRMELPDEDSPKPARPAWLVPALILSASIAIGAYWGMQRPWNGSSGPAVVAANSKPASGSSGSSGAPDEEPAPLARPSSQPHLQAPSRSSAPASGANIAAPAPPANDAQNPQPDRAQNASPAPRLSAEEELWRKASTSDKASAYESYLNAYPKGLYASVARLRLDSKQPKVAMIAPSSMAPSSLPQDAKPKAAPSASIPSPEDELWNTATAINQPLVYEAYLNKYPNGRYAPIAKDKLASARPAQPDPSAAQNQPPAATPKQAPEAAPQQPPAVQKAPPQAAPKPMPQMAAKPTPAPAPPMAASSTSLNLGEQTMTGDFSADPKTGIVSGTGKIVWTNGNQFDGTLVRGLKQGKGEFIWNNGQRYNGDWAKDMPNGKGTIVFANGGRYTGDVKDGVPHGQGVYRFKGGDVYSGAWIKGKSTGQGRYTWANGSYWEGEFKDDKRTGNGKMVFANRASDTSASTSLPTTGETQSSGAPAADKEAEDK